MRAQPSQGGEPPGDGILALAPRPGFGSGAPCTVVAPLFACCARAQLVFLAGRGGLTSSPIFSQHTNCPIPVQSNGGRVRVGTYRVLISHSCPRGVFVERPHRGDSIGYSVTGLHRHVADLRVQSPCRGTSRAEKCSRASR